MEVIAGGMGSRLERDMKATSGVLESFSLQTCVVVTWLSPDREGSQSGTLKAGASYRVNAILQDLKEEKSHLQVDTPSLKKTGRQEVDSEP